jgi:hypothetical protein
MMSNNFGKAAIRSLVSAVLFASSFAGTGCSGTLADADLQASTEDVETSQDALFYTLPGACEVYEAENIGRAGGAPSSGGWTLTNAGDNINVNRLFTAGNHAFSIIARGVAGGGQKPQIKLTLNGVQIGGNINVTNTSITSGWSEYVVHYNIGTGNNKLIKVELANPGSGRKLLLDGINLYCPRADVICGGGETCGGDACCQDTENVEAVCAERCDGRVGITLSCDQPSDCAGQGLCRIAGNPANVFGIGCSGVDALPGPTLPTFNREICKSPNYPEWACTQGGTCSSLGENFPGWKHCI